MQNTYTWWKMMTNTTKNTKEIKEAREIKERLIMQLGAPTLAKALQAMMREASKNPKADFRPNDKDIELNVARLKNKTNDQRLNQAKASAKPAKPAAKKPAALKPKSSAFSRLKTKLFGK